MYVAVGLESLARSRISTSAGMKKSADAFFYFPGKDSVYAELKVTIAELKYRSFDEGEPAFSIRCNMLMGTSHMAKLAV